MQFSVWGFQFARISNSLQLYILATPNALKLYAEMQRCKNNNAHANAYLWRGRG
jgi:hypothetical protein